MGRTHNTSSKHQFWPVTAPLWRSQRWRGTTGQHQTGSFAPTCNLPIFLKAVACLGNLKDNGYHVFSQGNQLYIIFYAVKRLASLSYAHTNKYFISCYFALLFLNKSIQHFHLSLKIVAVKVTSSILLLMLYIAESECGWPIRRLCFANVPFLFWFKALGKCWAKYIGMIWSGLNPYNKNFVLSQLSFALWQWSRQNPTPIYIHLFSVSNELGSDNWKAIRRWFWRIWRKSL